MAGNNTAHPIKGALRPGKELAYGEENILPSAELNPDQPAPVNNTGATRLTKGARFVPGQIARLWRTKRLTFGRLKTHSIRLSIRFSLTGTLSFFMHLIL